VAEAIERAGMGGSGSGRRRGEGTAVKYVAG
jgi:hypothetical protein